jgi:hypothetical protein
MNETPDYGALYRKANPKTMPFSIHERQRELRDLWPIDQQKFRDQVDVIWNQARSRSV